MWHAMSRHRDRTQRAAAGSSDVFAWDHSPRVAAQIAARVGRWQAVDDLVRSRAVCERLVGESRPWRQVMRCIVEIARFTEGTLLISGESGTGKELVAR